MKNRSYSVRVAIPSGLMIAALVLLTLLVGPARAGRVHAGPTACVPGPHSDTITADESWCLIDSLHLVQGCDAARTAGQPPADRCRAGGGAHHLP